MPCPRGDIGYPCSCKECFSSNITATPAEQTPATTKVSPPQKIVWIPSSPICVNCGAENPDHGDICGGCGEPTDIMSTHMMTLPDRLVRKEIQHKTKSAD